MAITTERLLISWRSRLAWSGSTKQLLMLTLKLTRGLGIEWCHIRNCYSSRICFKVRAVTMKIYYYLGSQIPSACIQDLSSQSDLCGEQGRACPACTCPVQLPGPTPSCPWSSSLANWLNWHSAPAALSSSLGKFCPLPSFLFSCVQNTQLDQRTLSSIPQLHLGFDRPTP